ncbi:hypothetical protein SAY87_004808 [Trapa incisa]|uniref:UBL3-like ubiquitin domain-containing protein n=1 Tax=Trapa incisa TaxID=236973 RepID=A0AAN7JPK0_9MYRT|nr:hypothetical protein SAY87_004808 [Trapa incisa]
MLPLSVKTKKQGSSGYFGCIKMASSAVHDQLEIRFRLTDGSDIGPKNFPVSTSVASLKESILSQWPKDKENGPKSLKDLKLISAGRILENHGTVADCRSTLYDVPGGVTTMHVIVQPTEKGKNLSAALDFQFSNFLLLCKIIG